MTESPLVEKKSNKKRNIILIVIAAVLVGGVLAFAFWPISDKQAYFKAEIDTYEWIKKQAEKRFTNELNWIEKVDEKPIETSIKLSPHYEDLDSFGSFNEIEELINNSSLTINTQSDMNKEQLSTDLSANIAGLDISDFYVYLEKEHLLVDFPFLPEPLSVESEDLGRLLHAFDPLIFDEDQTYDFSRIFDQENYPIPLEDQEYIVEKYRKLAYDLLPDDAFEQSTETITVDGESTETNKIQFHLTEEETITFFDSFVSEIQADEKLEEIIENYLIDNFLPSNEINKFFVEFDKGLKEVKANLKNINLPDGIQSTIWVNNDLIVQREIAIGFGQKFDGKVLITIEGTHALSENDQTFEYDIIVDESGFTETLTFAADLSIDDSEINDRITLNYDDIELIYEAEETLNKNKRDFDRSFIVLSPDTDGEITWTGNSTYEEDQMSSTHEFFVEAYDFSGIEIGLILDIDSKQIREIEPIDRKDAKDIGKMSKEEIEQYFIFEVANHFEQWLMQNIGMGSF